MRVTVNIDEDVLAVARDLADQQGGSLGSALSDLARRGFRRGDSMRTGEDPTVFGVAVDAPPITSEDVYRSLDEWP